VNGLQIQKHEYNDMRVSGRVLHFYALTIRDLSATRAVGDESRRVDAIVDSTAYSITGPGD
jgi:hypothetical protein